MDGPLSHRGIASGKLPFHEPEASETDALTTLQKVFGYEAFRPGQEGIIQTVLHGQNALAVMPTGSGKLLCFQIPALVSGGLTIVVSPLVALMRDQVDALRLLGVGAECISSGNTRSENVAAWRRTTVGETRLLYMAPERLMTEPMLAALNILPITHLPHFHAKLGQFC